jgi:regulator of protease activity HflC (stomatin/prohibitin superfamily)
MSKAHARPQLAKRRAFWIGLISAGALTAGAVAALAAGNSGSEVAAQSIACPDPSGAIPAVPASAQAEVTRELQNLQKQIDEANKRLVDTVGQGGPNFVQNAILGPLKDKRVAALNRIETAIGRAAAKPEGLEQFATCGLGQAPAVSAPPATSSPSTGGDSGNGGGQASGQIACPDPAGSIGAVPAAAQAEVDRELQNLQKQISEANTRLANSVGQGGPNFVQNAILGPLAGKRTAALDRIAIAIGRVGGARPQLAQFSTCAVGQAPAVSNPSAGGGAGSGTGNGNNGNNNGGGNNGGGQAVGQISCPDPTGAIPAVPASAQAEVTRELQGLQNQINEANTRLVNTVGQGGPNFVQNAILGPLADKRTAALNRIETAIGRAAAKPEGLERFATCQLG